MSRHHYKRIYMNYFYYLFIFFIFQYNNNILIMNNSINIDEKLDKKIIIYFNKKMCAGTTINVY